MKLKWLVQFEMQTQEVVTVDGEAPPVSPEGGAVRSSEAVNCLGNLTGLGREFDLRFKKENENTKGAQTRRVTLLEDLQQMISAGRSEKKKEDRDQVKEQKQGKEKENK